MFQMDNELFDVVFLARHNNSMFYMYEKPYFYRVSTMPATLHQHALIFVAAALVVACLLCAFNICVILHGSLDLVQNICASFISCVLRCIPPLIACCLIQSAGSRGKCRWICMCCEICNGWEKGVAGGVQLRQCQSDAH